MYYSFEWIKADWHDLGQTLKFLCFWALSATVLHHTFIPIEGSQVWAEFPEETFDVHAQWPHVCPHFILEFFLIQTGRPNTKGLALVAHAQATVLGSRGSGCSLNRKQQVSHLWKKHLAVTPCTGDNCVHYADGLALWPRPAPPRCVAPTSTLLSKS